MLGVRSGHVALDKAREGANYHNCSLSLFYRPEKCVTRRSLASYQSFQRFHAKNIRYVSSEIFPIESFSKLVKC